MPISGKKYTYNVEAVFKRYYGSLCYYGSRYVENEEVVEDLVQDIFVRLLESSRQFETSEHLRNFLYLSVRNACLNHIQKDILKERYRKYLQEHETTMDFPDEDILTAEVYRRLKQAVDELPVECRKIFYMSYFEGQENEKIADYLHLSVNTVRAQKMRGKKLLRDKLKHLFPFLFLFPEFFDFL